MAYAHLCMCAYMYMCLHMHTKTRGQCQCLSVLLSTLLVLFFKTGTHYVALAVTRPSCPGTQIYQPLPSESWIYGIYHHHSALNSQRSVCLLQVLGLRVCTTMPDLELRCQCQTFNQRGGKVGPSRWASSKSWLQSHTAYYLDRSHGHLCFMQQQTDFKQ